MATKDLVKEQLILSLKNAKAALAECKLDPKSNEYLALDKAHIDAKVALDEYVFKQKEAEAKPAKETIVTVGAGAMPNAFRQGSNDKRKAEVVLPKVQGTSAGIQGKTFASLDAQEKILVMLPVTSGEMHAMPVTINDVCYMVKRGVPQLVPVQVADMLNERLAAEGYLVNESVASQQRLKGGGIAS